MKNIQYMCNALFYQEHLVIYSKYYSYLRIFFFKSFFVWAQNSYLINNTSIIEENISFPLVLPPVIKNGKMEITRQLTIFRYAPNQKVFYVHFSNCDQLKLSKVFKSKYLQINLNLQKPNCFLYLIWIS